MHAQFDHSAPQNATVLEKEPPAARLSARPNMVPETWDQALRKLSGAYSDNTLRAYASDFRLFRVWCLQRGLSFLPAEPETLCRLIENQAKIHKPATVCRRLDAINRVHKLCGFRDPTDDEDVRLTLRRMQRRQGRRQKQALGLTAPLRDRLIDAASKDLRGLRNRALIAVGYDTLCRSAELVALKAEDIQMNPDGSGLILVRKAKNDPFAEGRLAYLSSRTETLLDRWLTAAGISEGWIFRGVWGKTISTAPIQTRHVGRIVKQLATAARIDRERVEALSSHSMRGGAAQDMAAAGIELTLIMHAGGGKSPTIVMRYIEHLEAARSGMARMYEMNKGVRKF